MRICGIVCEYNPFHNGHRYQIKTLKRDFGFDAIVGVMSGNWVERGDAAIFDKRIRAQAAVMNGVDLVVELPAIHSMQSAEIFAENAVYILNSLNIIDTIAFGTEADNAAILTEIANLLANESTMFKNIIRAEMNSGVPYFAARANAVGKILGSVHMSALSSPNNILAIEYIKALIRLNSKIKPLAIKRIGTGHDKSGIADGISSASQIREFIYCKNAEYLNLVPKNCHTIYKNAKKHDMSKLDNAIIAHFLKTDTNEIQNAPDVCEGLENKIKKAAQSARSINELCDAAKSKRYAYSRIRRIILNSYLNISKKDQNIRPLYVKVLNFTDIGQRILHSVKSSTLLPIGTNRNSVKGNRFAEQIWDRELVFDKIYDLTTCK